MPAKSAAQQRLMQAALHGADFPKAREIRQSMTREQIQDFTRRTGVIRNVADMRRTRPAQRSKG